MFPSTFQLVIDCFRAIAPLCGVTLVALLAFVYACRLDYRPRPRVQRDLAGGVVTPEDAGRTSRLDARGGS